MLALAFAGQFKSKLHDAISAAPRKHRLLGGEFVFSAAIHAPADRGIFALAVFAHDPKINITDLAISQRTFDARHQTHRAQVHVLIEITTERNQQTPEGNMIGYGRRPAGRAEKNRIMLAHLIKAVLRHHAAMFLIVVAAPVIFIKLQCKTKFARGGFENT